MTRYCLAFALPLVALALPGCGSDKSATDDPNSIAFNDYESVMGWQPDLNAVTREQAHSGKYSVVVNGGKEFAMGYTLPIGKATARITSSVISVGTFEAFLGQDTQIMPSGAIRKRAAASTTAI